MTSADYGNGLMAFWADVDEEYVMRYQQWHNCEHVPERVSIPGFLRGRRYRDLAGAPHFLMMYETESPAILASEPYLARLNSPTPWTTESLAHFSNPSRGIYSLAAAAGEEGDFCAGWLTTLRFNPGGEVGDDNVRDWLDAMAEETGIGRVQLWQADVATSGITTSERKIYGGSAPGDHLLLVIEAQLPHDAQGDVIGAGDAAAPPLAPRQNEILGRYWLEIYHHSNKLHGETG